MANAELDAVTRELRDAGIYDWTVAPTGSGHLQVRWSGPNGMRACTVAATGSDHRGPANMAAQTRRLLKEDGLLAPPKPPPVRVRARTWQSEIRRLEERIAQLERIANKGEVA
jgi:hypothetical protein